MIYFIQNEAGDVKIGRSTDPARRLAVLQSASPAQLKILRVIDFGTAPTEMWLHRRFAHHRLRGEWFSYHADMLTIEPPPEEQRDRTAASNPPLERAIDHCGSIAELARRIDRSPQIVAYWLKAVKGVPPEEVAAIERATDGVVPRHDLRPDIFGPREGAAA